MIAPKSTQKYQEIYRLNVQLAVMAAASSKTKMMPCGHVFPNRDYVYGKIRRVPSNILSSVLNSFYLFSLLLCFVPLRCFEMNKDN